MEQLAALVEFAEKDALPSLAHTTQRVPHVATADYRVPFARLVVSQPQEARGTRRRIERHGESECAAERRAERSAAFLRGRMDAPASYRLAEIV